MLQLALRLVRFFKLPRDMINMSFQRQNLLHIVLLLLLVFSESKRGSTNFFFSHLNLIKQFLVLTAERLNSMLKALNLQVGVSVVGQDVLLFDFQRTRCLLSTSLFIDEFGILSLQKLVGMRALSEFLVDEPVLSGQRLDVFSHLCHFLSLELGELSLLVDLLFHALALLSERLNLLFSLEELPLVCILLTSSNAHLMLHITEIKALLFMELFDLNQLLGLQVQLALQFVQVAIKHRN